MSKLSNQMIGNIGLYYVCYELSKREWNVLPTSRNTKGVDTIIFDTAARTKHTIQVKTSTKGNPNFFGTSKEILADFLIVCEGLEQPRVFIARKGEVALREGLARGKMNYWYYPTDYEKHLSAWDKLR